jgi:hypothetical protein
MKTERMRRIACLIVCSIGALIANYGQRPQKVKACVRCENHFVCTEVPSGEVGCEWFDGLCVSTEPCG